MINVEILEGNPDENWITSRFIFWVTFAQHSCRLLIEHIKEEIVKFMLFLDGMFFWLSQEKIDSQIGFLGN